MGEIVEEHKLNGISYREDGPAVVLSDGTKIWCRDGELHREDGPAIERGDGTKKWFIDGKLHREDGPAIIWSNGHKEWYIDGGEVEQFTFTKSANKK